MLILIFYYLVLPFIFAALVRRLIRRFATDPVPPKVRELCARDPVEKKWYRVLEVEGAFASPEARFEKIGDFDAQDKAVDGAYLRRAEHSAAARSWLVLDDKGDILQEVT